MSLTIENLKVTLQKKEILHGITLDIKEGEFISLLGKSGCGKTTLLKCIAGFLEVEEGNISIQGKSVMNVSPEKRGTVIVFQDLRLFPHMTVEKNIMFPMELRKVPKKIQKETVKKLLEDVQLVGFEKRKIREMSGGQMQRVAIARALAANPKVLLLDEAFSGLDENLRGEMRSLVKRLHEEWKITTILVTHDKREALQISDRIALMSEGEILQYDTPKRMFYYPSSKKVAEYFGEVNYIRGIVQKGKFVSELFSKEVDLPDGEYEAMIRPSSVKITENGKYKVTDSTFMGEIQEVNIQAGKQMLKSQVMNERVEKGDVVGIEISDKEISWFKSGEKDNETDYI
ncbi:ABC transporter ATP-binding protein [Eubacterium ventriosum]|uniref:ABC transporter ATP-binding protein n=1 Tax=Eubacterium ventriosum TaxID=39496 RepID=UPI003AB146F7